MARTKSINKTPTTELPYNLDAERVVLGSAMLNKDNCLDVLNSLEEKDFFLGKHQLIYRAISSIATRGVDVDVLTVAEELDNLKELENIGGAKYLAECTNTMVAKSTLTFYMRIIQDNSVLRNMLTTIRTIDSEYRNEEIENINDFILDSENRFKESIAKRHISNFVLTKDIADKARENLEKLQDADNDSDVIGVSTGYDRLNQITQGFKPGELIVVAARPAVGKTALALNFAYRAATRAKKPVAIFSLEMSSELLVRRLIASESLIPLKNLSTGQLSGEQRLKLSDAVKRVGGAPIYIDDTPGNKLMDIIAKSRKLQAKEPELGLIVVDYLGLVETSGNKGDSRQEEVRKISLALKQLAMELKIPVLALSQLSRDVEKQNRKPQLSDLRDSGSIEQDADVVMLLHREDYGKESKSNKYDNKKLDELTPEERKKLSMGQKHQMLTESLSGDASYVDVIIAKNRNGQTDVVPLFFYKSYGRFDTPPKEWKEQMRELSRMDSGD